MIQVPGMSNCKGEEEFRRSILYPQRAYALLLQGGDALLEITDLP
jgi:hypothetical protein